MRIVCRGFFFLGLGCDWREEGTRASLSPVEVPLESRAVRINNAHTYRPAQTDVFIHARLHPGSGTRTLLV